MWAQHAEKAVCMRVPISMFKDIMLTPCSNLTGFSRLWDDSYHSWIESSTISLLKHSYLYNFTFSTEGVYKRSLVPGTEKNTV